MDDAEPVEFNRTGNKKKVQRPWGSIELLSAGPGFSTSRLTVGPLNRLPRHWHRHRDEHWVVARGAAKISVDGMESVLGPGQSIDIPRTIGHGVENISSIDPLEVIEVQTGDYLGEDDVVFVDDEASTPS